MLVEVAPQPLNRSRTVAISSLFRSGVLEKTRRAMSRFSDEHHVFITQSKHSKIGMRWRRITQESLRDGVWIWIDSRLISSQSFLSPIVPAASAAVYIG